VIDAIDLGYKVTVIVDACKAINLYPEDESEAFATMNEKGAMLICSSAL
jgi:nicotinamidase/pyrazinamidase